MNQPLRQGDVFIIPVTKIPAGTRPVERDNGRVILAYGEVTGHSHAIADRHASLLSTAENERFLRIVGSGSTLVHEEHGSIAIPAGDYRVVIGREFTADMQARQVVD